MKKTIIPFDQVPQLAKTDVAYAIGDPKLQPFFTYPPAIDSFIKLLPERSTAGCPRNDLADLLQRQYSAFPVHEKVKDAIEALRRENTFTITTAHQPCLFLGPLYFIYKALTTITLAEAVQARTGNDRQIIPVFVLGSEDHDLEELNKVNLFGKKIVWQPNLSGAVGSMAAESLTPALEELKAMLGEEASAQALYNRVEQAYSGAKDFAGATQALLHEFLGEFGLVVLNMNDPALKRHFIPVMRQELLEQPSYTIVNNTIAQLNAAGFKTQAAPREINLFYMKPGMRERIVLEDGIFKVLNTSISFTKTGIQEELEAHPEHFSPNVVLRPLFQEMVLPNLAYVGGGGELAYWLERKPLFSHFNVPFPILVRRHSILWLDRDALKKLEKFGFSPADFFGDTDVLVRQYIEKNAAGEISLSVETNELKAFYDKLAQKAGAVDPTLEKALRAEAVKAIAGLEQWESRLVRAEKQKHEVAINQLRTLKEKLFPNNGLQERTDNILPYLLKYGPAFLEELKSAIQAFDAGFLVLQADEVQ